MSAHLHRAVLWLRLVLVCLVLTGVSAFSVGAARTWVTARSWWRSGLEMLAVGTLSGGAAYLVGLLVGTLTR